MAETSTPVPRRVLVGDAARPSAWLFDLDGVLTDTATLHDRAWKAIFDRFLASLDPPGRPFDPIEDYERYVDGKPHNDGVRDFLASRGIVLPEGTGDRRGPGPTVTGIAATKNARYLELLASEGAAVFPDAAALLGAVRDAGRRCAVVTASENLGAVLRAAGLEGAFDAQVDGLVAKRHRLQGKPAPDTYLFGAALLGAAPKDAVVVEDAPAGAAAGRAGGFGLVVGVARRASEEELRSAGADVVVRDLTTLLGPAGGGQ